MNIISAQRVLELAKEAGAMFDHMTWVERDLAPVFERFATLVQAEVEAEWIETNKALAKEIIELKKAEPLKQEPVAWAHPNGGYLSDKYIKEFATGMEIANYNIPLYAEPVDVKAIRAEALEEAADQCDRIASNGSFDAEDCAAAIRGLK